MKNGEKVVLFTLKPGQNGILTVFQKTQLFTTFIIFKTQSIFRNFILDP